MKRIRRLLYPQTRTGALAPFLAAVLVVATAAVALAAWQAEPRRPASDQGTRESRYEKWLNEDVIYIIADQERAAFLGLATDEEREMFIEQFWLRRDPTPGTPENEFRTEHYRRIAYANEHFATQSGTAGWRTDRGRILITCGPPDEIESHIGGSGQFSREMWLYHHIDGIGDEITVEFVDQTGTGDYRIPKKL